MSTASPAKAAATSSSPNTPRTEHSSGPWASAAPTSIPDSASRRTEPGTSTSPAPSAAGPISIPARQAGSSCPPEAPTAATLSSPSTGPTASPSGPTISAARSSETGAVQAGSALDVTGDGQVLLAGRFHLAADFDPGPGDRPAPERGWCGRFRGRFRPERKSLRRPQPLSSPEFPGRQNRQPVALPNGVHQSPHLGRQPGRSGRGRLPRLSNPGDEPRFPGRGHRDDLRIPAPPGGAVRSLRLRDHRGRRGRTRGRLGFDHSRIAGPRS